MGSYCNLVTQGNLEKHAIEIFSKIDFTCLKFKIIPEYSGKEFLQYQPYLPRRSLGHSWESSPGVYPRYPVGTGSCVQPRNIKHR